MSTILVTGASGQLGSELKRIHTVLPSFRFIFTDIHNLDLRDKTSAGKFIKNEMPAFIINCAAYTAVDKAENDEETAFVINRDVPATLTFLADEVKARLIHISTDFVFDGKTDKPYSEEDVTSPLSVYAKSKLAGEKEVLKGNYNLVIRTSWLYSAYGTNFVKTMLRLGKERKELGVVADQFGSPTRAGDLAAAILTVINRESVTGRTTGGIYHYTNEGSCSWHEFASEIMRLAGLPCQVRPLQTHEYPLPAKRPAYSVLSKNKIRTEFNLEIPEWKDSLAKSMPEIIASVNSDKS